MDYLSQPVTNKIPIIAKKTNGKIIVTVGEYEMKNITNFVDFTKIELTLKNGNVINLSPIPENENYFFAGLVEQSQADKIINADKE